MAEQVKYTEQERMEAFDFLEAQMALKTPMREWGLNLAAKLHSVRAEAQQARVAVAVCSTLDNTAARLAVAEKLAKATQSFRNEVVEWIRDVEVGFPCNPYPADNVEEIKAIDEALAEWKEAGK